MEDSRESTPDAGSVTTRFDTVSASFETNQSNIGVIQERMKNADRIRTATYTSDNGVRKPTSQ